MKYKKALINHKGADVTIKASLIVIAGYENDLDLLGATVAVVTDKEMAENEELCYMISKSFRAITLKQIQAEKEKFDPGFKK